MAKKSIEQLKKELQHAIHKVESGRADQSEAAKKQNEIQEALNQNKADIDEVPETVSQSELSKLNVGTNNLVTGKGATATGGGIEVSGSYAHGEGIGLNAEWDSNLEEWVYLNTGRKTTASGKSSHAEGYGTTASGRNSHTQGNQTIASGVNSHAEGSFTEASGNNSHAEGEATASGQDSHAEGGLTESSGKNSHAEGGTSIASADNSHAEGEATASGSVSHAEGGYTTASGQYSHAEGYSTKAQGENSHAEGANTTASIGSSHAEGYKTTASTSNAHAEGRSTKAGHKNSHSAGWGSKTEGKNDHVHAGDNTALNPATSNNIFRINGNGINGVAGDVTASGTFSGGGADYAESFEWQDGNPDNKDRAGYFVSLTNGDKIEISGADPIGIVSPLPAVLGDAQYLKYKQTFETDDFGRTIRDPYQVTTYVEQEKQEETEDQKAQERIEYEVYKDADGNLFTEVPNPGNKSGTEFTGELPSDVTWDETVQVKRVNPDFDPEKEYKNRHERSEWDAIGLIGKLIVFDDGNASPGDKVTPKADGTAEKSTDGSGYHILKRISSDKVQVLFK